MALVPLDGVLVADITPSVGAVAPYDAYAGWATALGVSGTATLQALDADDNAWAITLASAPIPGGTSLTAGFSSEGALGLYAAPPANTSSSSLSLTDVSRMYMTGTRPDALFTFHPQTDLRTEAVLLQRSGNTTIIRGLLRAYGSSAYTARFAIRLDGVNARFIFAPVDQPLNFKLFKASSNTSIYSSPCAAGGLFEFAATLSCPTIAAGFTSTVLGSPELTSRLALGTAETSFGVPSTPMQALSSEPTTTFGLAAQAHPAAGFTSTATGAPQLIPSALGFKPTAFGIGSILLNASGTAPGTVFGLASQAHPVAGFGSTLFGSPEILPSALGFSGTAFGPGAGSRQVFPIPTLSIITSFGTSNFPYNQTLVVSPWAQATEWGRPLGFKGSGPVVNIACASASVLPGAIGYPAYNGGIVAVSVGSAPETVAGTPTAFKAAAVTALVTGSDLSAIVGNPSASLRYRSTASSPGTEFGLASKALGNEASGTRSTLFGTPASARGLYALGALHQARWGLASATRAGDHPASTRYVYTRFGQPKATLVKGERASGAAATTTFGSPSCAWRMRGLHIPPGTYFGAPRVARTSS